VAELERPDGTRIHYEIQGETGPALVLASYWSWIPGIYTEMLADVARDHRVVTYHLRGTGESSRHGPYDQETDIGDLEAVVETVGGPAMLLATADASNRVTKLAARRPDLISAAINLGTAPFARASFEGEEGMVASSTVVDAFGEMLESNYRGAMRTLMEATNTQASEEELRDRVAAQARFISADAALGRWRAWIDDDPREAAREAGDRLWIFTAPGIAGPWLPSAEVLQRLMRETMPEARVVEIESESGPISRPDEAAEMVRRVSRSVAATLQGRD
jgi:pimeloyl-ACP methyl ester carboxylesterase